jgi:ketosteroid isomerase-like protein
MPRQHDQHDDFDAFMRRRIQASDAFVNGDHGPLGAISTDNPPATLFGPKGDCVAGPAAVNAANREGAAHFGPGSDNRFDVMHCAADGDLAYWTGIQRSVVNVKGQAQPVPMDLRVTEIFRREDGAWKLIHRHADRLGGGKPG